MLQIYEVGTLVFLPNIFVKSAQFLSLFFYALNNRFFSIFSMVYIKIKTNPFLFWIYPLFFPYFSFFVMSSLFAFTARFFRIKKAVQVRYSHRQEYFRFYRKKPLTISSSASFSVNPSVISLMSCSPAIFPIAASWIKDASG